MPLPDSGENSPILMLLSVMPGSAWAQADEATASAARAAAVARRLCDFMLVSCCSCGCATARRACLLHAIAAVDVDDAAGDVARGFRGQVAHGVGHFLRRADAPQRDGLRRGRQP